MSNSRGFSMIHGLGEKKVLDARAVVLTEFGLVT
jgi:hypothetical protein